MQGDVSDDTYALPAAYQRIFNPLTNILRCLVDSEPGWIM